MRSGHELSFPIAQARWLAEGSRGRAPGAGPGARPSAGAEDGRGRTKAAKAAKASPRPKAPRPAATVRALHPVQPPMQLPHRQCSQSSRLRIPLRTQPSSHVKCPAVASYRRGAAPRPAPQGGAAHAVGGGGRKDTRPGVTRMLSTSSTYGHRVTKPQHGSKTRLLNRKKSSSHSGVGSRPSPPLKPKLRARPAPRTRPDLRPAPSAAPHRDYRAGASAAKQERSKRSQASLSGTRGNGKPRPTELRYLRGRIDPRTLVSINI